MLLVNAAASGPYILYVLLAPCLLASGVVFNKKLKSLDLRWLDGLLAVFVVHASYNLLALTLLIAEQHLRKAPGLLRRASASVASASS